MPLGNGDIGLNLWVEEGGDLLFYISKTDAWSGNTRLLKLGRIRVKLAPNPFGTGMEFKQALRLAEGAIEILAGKPGAETRIQVWADANNPVIRIEATGKQPFTMRTSLETWRTRQRVLEDNERHSAYGMEDGPEPVVEYPDTVLPERNNRVYWYHRNATSGWGSTLKLQGLESLTRTLQDPLLNLTFGGAVVGTRSPKPATNHLSSIHILTARTATADEWRNRLDRQIARVSAAKIESARDAHRKWWNEFWERSWIHVQGSEEAERTAQGYALQRFISACAGRGAYPIKFNGSIFTVDARLPKETYDADYRRWGGPYWFQNTRLAYWPMLASGDLEMMEPFFKMYLSALGLAEARTKIYFGHGGVFFPETMHFWGAYANTNYGWKRDGKPVWRTDNTYIRYYWSGALELLAIMLDRYAFRQDEEFLKTRLLPLAQGILRFYDEHYPRDPDGKLRFYPAASLETWQEVVNPLPEIAGLHYVLSRMLELPLDSDLRSWLTRLRAETPPLPNRSASGRTALLVAQENLAPIMNVENPELYAIFPYRLYGLGKPDLDVGLATFERRRFKRTGGWTQDPIQAALLGLTEVARKYTAENFLMKDPGSRFPAFWGPNFDWIPDQDHGTVALKALQTMLVQYEGKKIILFPAWPKQWDVDFKLRAPFNSVVEGVYRSGRLERITVSPESRRADLVQMTPN